MWSWSESIDTTGAVASPSFSFETGGNASAVSFAADGAHVAVGDRDRDLAVWDVATAAPTFKARNVPDDNLDLAVPVWVSALCHVPTQPSWLCMGTGHVQQRLRGEVRLYDVAAKRRPVARTIAPLGEEAMRAVACTPDGRYVLAGSISGLICRLDVRMNLKPLHRYTGTAGSIRAICPHASLPLFACVSLDRSVRLYRIEGNRHNSAPAQKVYLKQRLSALLLSSEAQAGGHEDDEDIEAMLDALPEADDGDDEAPISAAAAGEEEEEDDDDDDGDGMDELDGIGVSGSHMDAADDDDEDDVDDDPDEADTAAAQETQAKKMRRQQKEAGGKRKGAGEAPRAALKKKKKKKLKPQE